MSQSPEKNTLLIERRVLGTMHWSGTATASDIHEALGSGATPEDVRSALLSLQESGHVLMRNGHYRLSEAAKMGALRNAW